MYGCLTDEGVCTVNWAAAVLGGSADDIVVIDDLLVADVMRFEDLYATTIGRASEGSTVVCEGSTVVSVHAAIVAIAPLFETSQTTVGEVGGMHLP